MIIFFSQRDGGKLAKVIGDLWAMERETWKTMAHISHTITQRWISILGGAIDELGDVIGNERLGGADICLLFTSRFQSLL